eukprot:250428-Amphidinium_carterae.2
MPRAARALRGFRKIRPPVSRPPCPESVMFMATLGVPYGRLMPYSWPLPSTPISDPAKPRLSRSRTW